jgi:NADH-quinone oxidoreductase subunit E
MKHRTESAVGKLLSSYQHGQESLITLLQDIQQTCGYLPREALQQVSAHLDIPLSKFFSLATFYNAFSLEPQGKHIVSVCLGTACHVKKGASIAQILERKLGLKETEETTPDGMFTLKKVRCLGCCSMAPVVKINKTIYGHLTHAKIDNVVNQYRKDSEQ